MSAPRLQPVYLALPSRGLGEVAPQLGASTAITAFVDHLARHPATAESAAVGAVEFCAFVNELGPLGTPLRTIARLSVSGFDGLSYTALFDELAALLRYDAYRLVDDRCRLGRPMIALLLDAPPAADDDWKPAHCRLTAPDDDDTVPEILTVAISPAAQSFAEQVAFPAERSAVAAGPADAGRRAAALTLAAGAPQRRGIGEHISPHWALKETKGIRP